MILDFSGLLRQGRC